jgi:AbrB family looped-hinge helix DNA binding protein
VAIATVTSKGQVTIPKSIRDALRLHTGDKLEFIVTQEGDTLVRPVTKKVDDVFGRLRKPKRGPVSVEEMDSAIRRRARTQFK